MTEAPKHEPKISLPEAMLIVEYVLIADIIGIALLLFGLDDFFILDILTFPVTQIYFRMKGVRAGYDLGAGLLELIPYVGALPIKTIGVLVTIALDWYFPEAAAIVGGAAKLKNPVGAAAPAPAAQAAGH